MNMEAVVVTVVGSSAAMGGALCFGFKKMVDLLGKQLTMQNGMIEKLQASSTQELVRLTDAVDRTTEAVNSLERHTARDAKSAAKAVSAASSRPQKTSRVSE